MPSNIVRPWPRTTGLTTTWYSSIRPFTPAFPESGPPPQHRDLPPGNRRRHATFGFGLVARPNRAPTRLFNAPAIQAPKRRGPSDRRQVFGQAVEAAAPAALMLVAR